MTDKYIRAWIAVDPDGDLELRTIHPQIDGAKALVVALKSWREVSVCQWADFAASGWTVQPITIVEGHEYADQQDDMK